MEDGWKFEYTSTDKIVVITMNLKKKLKKAESRECKHLYVSGQYSNQANGTDRQLS